jgi:hypothetical protein
VPGSGTGVSGLERMAGMSDPESMALPTKVVSVLKPRNPIEKSPPNGIPGPPEKVTTGAAIETAQFVKELAPPRAVDSAQVRVPEKSALLTTKTRASMVAPPRPVVMSLEKKHPGAGVEMPPWIRKQSVPSVGLLPVGVRMRKVGKVMGTEPLPPPALITGSAVGIESACAPALDNTTNAANATVRSNIRINFLARMEVPLFLVGTTLKDSANSVKYETDC